MLRPAYNIKIGSGSFDPASGGDVLSVSVECDLNVPLDVFSIMLRPGDKASSVKRGDEVSIEIGNEGALTKVMTGMVESVRPGVTGIAVTGYSLAMVMAGIKLHQIYEKQASGAIVKDLVEKAGLKAKDPEDGITYPMYTIDTSRSIYEHMRELASLSGFDLFLNADGAVIFKKFEGKKPKKFKYGRDIIGCEVREITPPYTSVKVIGESPASTKGSDKAHWLSKGGTGVTSGNGDRVLIVRHPAIRDKDTADQVAAAKMESILVELAGTLKVLGNPKVGLGDTIEIKEMPDGRMNGEFEAVRVSHTMNGQEGYVTTIGWIKKVTVSPGESPDVEEPSVPAPPKAPGMLEEMLQKAKEVEEAAKEKLVEAVEAAEEALEGILQELQAAMAEVDKKAAEMIAAAGEAKKAAEEAAREALKQVDELKKELEEKKKELQKAIDEGESKYNDLKADAKKELDKVKEEASKIEKEAADLEKQAEDKLAEAKKSVEDELKPIQDEVDKAKKTVGEWENKAKELEGEARKKLDEAKKSVEDELKPLQAEADRIKRSIDEEMNKIGDLKKQLPGAGASVQGQSADTDKARKEIEDRIKEAEGKVEGLKKQAEDKLKQVEAKKDQLLDKEKELEKELEGKLKEGEDKVKDLKKQAEDKLKEIEGKKDQLLGKEKDLEKELKDKKEEAMKKLGEAKAKGEEAEKKAGEKLKEIEDKVKEARQKLEEGTKEIQDKIDEAQSTANSILKEANKKYDEAVKKAEEARKELARSMESMKSAYKSAKDKVAEGKKAAGLE
jgi:hypothetical protein